MRRKSRIESIPNGANMCGIVGAIAQRPVAAILIEGLKRLEYRGYDSAGVALITERGLERCRRVGKVAELAHALDTEPLIGQLGIAHTRWATHGIPSEANAHPHTSRASSQPRIAVVHNGIIENHAQLRSELEALGYVFSSETDTETIAHLLHYLSQSIPDLRSALQQALPRLHGAYGLAVISSDQPDRILATRSGSPLVIGVGIGEHFIASDPLALRQVTDRFVYLAEGDIAEIRQESYQIWDASFSSVQRPIEQAQETAEAAEKGSYRHFMLKEIDEQPKVVQQALAERISATQVQTGCFGARAEQIFSRVKNIQIVACGTSYHAGLVAKYWLEELTNTPCQVEVASEFRYRKVAVQPDTLFVSISQSGETADTLAALRHLDSAHYLASLTICNVASSSLVRESDLALLTKAGPEIGVASTKAFTTQLVGLLLLTLAIGRARGSLLSEQEQEIVEELHQLPSKLYEALALNGEIEQLSALFADKQHCLFLGRGEQFPIALEGALKLKEISYIHAEAYPAGELKHGPLALVDSTMPVVTVAPNNQLLEKLKSNLQEVRARGGELVIFADASTQLANEPNTLQINMPSIHPVLAPILYTIPLQLLSYHVAVIKGTDVDQPRNLAKSVTVE